jgi:hypothetical protein
MELASLLDHHILKDAHGALGSVLCELGNVYLHFGMKKHSLLAPVCLSLAMTGAPASTLASLLTSPIIQPLYFVHVTAFVCFSLFASFYQPSNGQSGHSEERHASNSTAGSTAGRTREAGSG